MTITLRKNYSRIAKGSISAAAGWMEKLNQSFSFPDKATATGGTATVEMWDTFTTYTPTVGTIQANQGSNLFVDLTVGSIGTKLIKTVAQKSAMEFDADAMTTAAEMAGDALRKELQILVLAALFAATPGVSPALPTGYIDFAIPSGATDPDIVNNVFYPLTRAFGYVNNRAGGGDDIVIFMQENACNHLEAAYNANWRPGQLTMSTDGQLRWKTAPIFSMQNTTDYGGASKPCAYVVAGRGLALRADDPFLEVPTDNGWKLGDDNHYHWPWQLPYALGVVKTSMLAEIVNPAT